MRLPIAAHGDNAYNNEVAGLLDEMLGSDNNAEVDASALDEEERGRGQPVGGDKMGDGDQTTL